MLGYTRATMVLTMGCKEVTSANPKIASSDCIVTRVHEAGIVVIADQPPGNTFPGLVHTARHTMEVGYIKAKLIPLTMTSNWGEVVTR